MNGVYYQLVTRQNDGSVPCPDCGETDIDLLEWQTEEMVMCLTCGHAYKPKRDIGA